MLEELVAYLTVLHHFFLRYSSQITYNHRICEASTRFFPHATTDSYVDVDGTEIQLTSWIMEFSHYLLRFYVSKWVTIGFLNHQHGAL